MKTLTFILMLLGLAEVHPLAAQTASANDNPGAGAPQNAQQLREQAQAQRLVRSSAVPSVSAERGQEIMRLAQKAVEEALAKIKSNRAIGQLVGPDLATVKAEAGSAPSAPGRPMGVRFVIMSGVKKVPKFEDRPDNGETKEVYPPGSIEIIFDITNQVTFAPRIRAYPLPMLMPDLMALIQCKLGTPNPELEKQIVDELNAAVVGFMLSGGIPKTDITSYYPGLLPAPPGAASGNQTPAPIQPTPPPRPTSQPPPLPASSPSP